MYNTMAQLLAGHDVTGTILQFDQDGDVLAGGTKHKEVFVFSFARLLVKDEIKKGSFSASFGVGHWNTPFAAQKNISDYGAANEFRVNSPAGEYGLLYTSSDAANANSSVGSIFYQAGIMILTASFFNTGSDQSDHIFYNATADDGQTINRALTGSSIQTICDGIRKRVFNIQFNNTVELNSTIYFCRLNHNEFNYSSNPTYLSGSKIRVKNSTIDEPVTYVTTIGLYSPDNELLAVGKLSEPLKKTPGTELIIKR